MHPYRVVAAGLIFILLLPAVAWAASGGPIRFSLSPIYLNPEDTGQDQVGRLRFLAGYELTTDDIRFGGLSGLIIDDDREHFLGITDTARWLTGRLRHDDKGVLFGLADTMYGTMHERDGRPLAPNGSKSKRDSEAVTRAADGAYLVSFERDHRILRFAGAGAGIDGTPTAVPLPNGAEDMPSNGGLEAMTTLPDGRLLLFTEDMVDDDDNVVGWLAGSDGSHRISLAATGSFHPTDLTTLSNGDVLLLERRYSPFGGAGGRISRITAAQLAAGGRMVSEELAVLQPPMSVDNYEALAAAPAPGGGWLIYVMSDDNFNMLQRTLLLQFYWDGK